MGGNGGMEPEEEKKKLNDDVVVFLKTDPPRYNARLHAYVDLQRKRSRAAAARRRSEQLFKDCRTIGGGVKKNEKPDNANANRDLIDKAKEDDRRKVENDEGFLKRWRSGSASRSEPSERCGRRRRRRSCRRRRRRRRRRSCGRRRRRRRRSCGRRRRRRRRSCGRRRRRSCSRRRRRRSCGRRRRRSRRRRRRC